MSKQTTQQYNRKYRSNNKAKIKLIHANYYQENKEMILKKARENYRANSEAKKKSVAKYREEHPDKVSAAKRNWREADPARAKKRVDDWRKANPEHLSIWKKNRRARKMAAHGSHTVIEWENMKAEYNWTCPSCGRSEPWIILTEDHIVPLSENGANYISNIQPLCRSCNSIKGTKTIKFLKDYCYRGIESFQHAYQSRGLKLLSFKELS